MLCVSLVMVQSGEHEEALELGLGAIRGPVELGPEWLWAMTLPCFRVRAVRGGDAGPVALSSSGWGGGTGQG